MKKLLIFLFAVLVLVGCAEKRASDDFIKKVDKEFAEQNEKLKKNAKPADFVKVNGNEIQEGTELYAEGTVKVINDEEDPEFSLNTKEGVYRVKSYDSSAVQDGDRVKVYGTYEGKTDKGIPILDGPVIEKQK